MQLYVGRHRMNSVMMHTDTDDATLKASDLQAGIVAYAKGQRVTGSGKSFEFASYGEFETNNSLLLPGSINVIQITCMNYPVKATVKVAETKNLDFSTEQTVGKMVVDGAELPVTVSVANNKLSIKCDKTTNIEIFYGKDNYT